MNLKFKIGNWRLANVAVATDEPGEFETSLLGMANEISGEEWIQLTPIGDFPHARGMQRVDKAAIAAMANQFNSALSRVGRALFGGVPFYVGHPDVPGMANEYPDKSAKGWIKALEARADGLYGQVDWNPRGKELIANKEYKFFSPYWDAKVLGVENKKTVYQPTALLSVGLTNNPNLPGLKPLANERETQMNTTIELATLVALLGLANTATQADVTNKITELKNEAGKTTGLANEKTTAETALGNEKTAHATTKTTLTNVIAQRNKVTLENAIDKGFITPAQRAEWETKLNENFDTASAEIKALKAGMKVTAATAGAGGRRSTLANTSEVQQRTQQVQTLVQKEMKETGCDYPTAFNKVQLANAALFEQMHDSRNQD